MMNNSKVALVTAATVATYTPYYGTNPSRAHMSETEFRHQFHSKAGLAKRKAARKQARASRKKNRSK